jgi:hypothetical protein
MPPIVDAGPASILAFSSSESSSLSSRSIISDGLYLRTTSGVSACRFGSPLSLMGVEKGTGENGLVSLQQKVFQLHFNQDRKPKGKFRLNACVAYLNESPANVR